MRKFSTLLITILATFILTTGLMAQEGEGNTKGLWYIGFGLGTGDGSFTDDGTEMTYDDVFEGLSSTVPLTVNLGIGAIVTQKIHAGLDISAVRKTGTIFDGTFAMQVNNYFGSVSLYPFNEGLFLKGGIGYSALVFEATGFVGGDSTDTYGGMGGLVGVGYNFWIGETFNLGVNIEYTMQSYSDEDGPDSGNFWNAYVSCYWF